MRQRVKLGVVAAALLVLLVGCGSSPEAPDEPRDTSEGSRSSPSSSPSATESEGAPGETEGSSTTEKLDAAAKAEVARAVEVYLETLNTAYQTGDTTEVKSLADEKCGFCVDVAGYIDDVYGQGGRIENCEAATPQDVIVEDLLILNGPDEQVRQVPYSAKIRVTECVTYDQSGSVINREPDGTESVQFLLNQEGDRWLIRTWEIEDLG